MVILETEDQRVYKCTHYTCKILVLIDCAVVDIVDYDLM